MIATASVSSIWRACRTARVRAHHFAVAFAVLASVFVLLLATLLPPIQGPDEGAHFVRADQISKGQLLAFRFGPGAAGGLIDLGIMAAIDRFYPIVTDINGRATVVDYAPIAWGKEGLWNFPNTALYPPVFYLPASGAIVAGRAAGLDVLHTDILARLGQAAASIVLATFALSLSGPAAIWLFAVLLLPSSAALMGSLTQDGPLLASAALAGALLLRVRPDVARWRILLGAACILLALLGMSRPPYAAFALASLACSRVALRVRIAASTATLAAIVAWCGYCAAFVFVSVDGNHQANPVAQLHYLLTHVPALPTIVWRSFRTYFIQDYAGYFVTTFAPYGIFNLLAWAGLAAALAGSLAAGAAGAAMPVLVAGFCTIACATGIFLIQYLTWSPVGGPLILGVLGRYFLPVAVMAPMALAGRAQIDRGVPVWLALPVLMFPVLSIVSTMHHLVFRYYVH